MAAGRQGPVLEVEGVLTNAPGCNGKVADGGGPSKGSARGSGGYNQCKHPFGTAAVTGSAGNGVGKLTGGTGCREDGVVDQAVIA